MPGEHGPERVGLINAMGVEKIQTLLPGEFGRLPRDNLLDACPFRPRHVRLEIDFVFEYSIA